MNFLGWSKDEDCTYRCTHAVGFPRSAPPAVSCTEHPGPALRHRRLTAPAEPTRRPVLSELLQTQPTPCSQPTSLPWNAPESLGMPPQQGFRGAEEQRCGGSVWAGTCRWEDGCGSTEGGGRTPESVGSMNLPPWSSRSPTSPHIWYPPTSVAAPDWPHLVPCPARPWQSQAHPALEVGGRAWLGDRARDLPRGTLLQHQIWLIAGRRVGVLL